MDNKAFYDQLSSVYDVMFPQESQKVRVDFLDRIFTERGVKTVLDAGCGTGRQVIDLALRGFRVTGTDISTSMLERASENMKANGLDIPLIQSDFASLGHKVQGEFGGVYCIGNSLPHVADALELRASLLGMINVLEPGGVLILHLRNYARFVKEELRLMPTLSGMYQGQQYIFQRIIDFLPDGRLNFSILTLHAKNNDWQAHISTTIQYPATYRELADVLGELGMLHITAYSDFKGSPFTDAAENLVLTARKKPITDIPGSKK